jgi:hypothetical protein
MEGGSKLIAVLELYAFADESGIHDGAKMCVLAGFLSSPRQWTLFETAWNQALGPDVAPVGFHAKEFFGGGGLYRGWSQQRSKKFLRGFWM